MQFEIKIDSAYTEPKVLILTDSVTEEVNGIVKKLSEDIPQIISGSKDEKVEVLEQAEIIRISNWNHNRLYNHNHYFLYLGKWVLFPLRTGVNLGHGE